MRKPRSPNGRRIKRTWRTRRPGVGPPEVWSPWLSWEKLCELWGEFQKSDPKNKTDAAPLDDQPGKS